jgi:RNA polymerase sigma-70 factor (ECF subfamily)
MTDSPATRHSLLVRIRDAQDAEAWTQFVDLYAPLVYGFARRRGLQDADAADLTQEVLRAVVRAAQRQDYDPKKGHFRNWLFTIALNKLRNFRTGRRRHPPGSGDSADQVRLEEHPDRASDDAAWWEREYEQRLFDWAAEHVRGEFEESTWQAFWCTAIDGTAAKEVGASLGMSVGAVYIAKSRVLARLKASIEQLELDGDSP